MAPWVGPFSPYPTWGGVRLPQDRSASDPRDVCIPRPQGSDDCRSSRDGYRVHRSASANLSGGIPPFPPATGGLPIVQFRPPTCLDDSDTALQQSPDPLSSPICLLRPRCPICTPYLLGVFETHKNLCSLRPPRVVNGMPSEQGIFVD